jgi:hypothetical protein
MTGCTNNEKTWFQLQNVEIKSQVNNKCDYVLSVTFYLYVTLK